MVEVVAIPSQSTLLEIGWPSYQAEKAQGLTTYTYISIAESEIDNTIRAPTYVHYIFSS